MNTSLLPAGNASTPSLEIGESAKVVFGAIRQVANPEAYPGVLGLNNTEIKQFLNLSMEMVVATISQLLSVGAVVDSGGRRQADNDYNSIVWTVPSPATSPTPRRRLTVAEVKSLGGYKIIYGDPPWRFDDKGCNGAAEGHYSTMNLQQLMALPVEQIVADDAVLFMWSTWPKIEDALALIPKWGFKYKSIGFVWLKYRAEKVWRHGLGRWTRGNTEFVLLATRGKPHRISNNVSQIIESFDYLIEETGGNIVHADVTRHSAKPPEVRKRILELMGDQPRIELFSRSREDGFDIWGNQVDSDIIM